MGPDADQARHRARHGLQGPGKGLLDAETNLKYAVKYLAGAWLVADGNPDLADRLYQRGYYYDAKRKGLLDETGLGRDRVRRRRHSINDAPDRARNAGHEVALVGAAFPAESWGRYINARYGYGVDIPAGFSPVHEADNGDGGVSRSADRQSQLSVWGANLLCSIRSRPTSRAALKARRGKAGRFPTRKSPTAGRAGPVKGKAGLSTAVQSGYAMTALRLSSSNIRKRPRTRSTRWSTIL